MTYRSRRLRQRPKKGKHNLLATIIIIIVLLYVSLTWVVPSLINGVGFITGIFKGQREAEVSVSDNPNLAPPVLSIPYEATNSAKIDIKGFATSGSKVKIYLDDELTTSVVTKEDGSFLAKEITLSLGTNNIYGRSEDDEGIESLPSKTIHLIFDSEKPPLEVTNPSDGQAFTGEKKINVTGKTEPGVTVSVNGDQAILNADGNFSKQISLNDGSNSLIIKSTDKASNFTQITRNVTFNP